jgi:hypothetical protein
VVDAKQERIRVRACDADRKNRNGVISDPGDASKSVVRFELNKRQLQLRGVASAAHGSPPALFLPDVSSRHKANSKRTVPTRCRPP